MMNDPFFIGTRITYLGKKCQVSVMNNVLGLVGFGAGIKCEHDKLFENHAVEKRFGDGILQVWKDFGRF